MNDVEKALHIAKKAHVGQIDKAGCEYINHPIHVADSLNTEEEKIVAYLHDVLEDTSMTIEDLANEGFRKQSSRQLIQSQKRKTNHMKNMFKK